jgi:hypothetical protein
MIELKSAKMRDLIEERYWKLERGVESSFLPHRIMKIRLCNMHPYPSNFFLFL